jgi:hypothetical protein
MGSAKGGSGREKCDITVVLSGGDGNVFSIVAKVRRAMRDGGVEQTRIERFTNDVMEARSYDDAIQVVMRYVEVV